VQVQVRALSPYQSVRIHQEVVLLLKIVPGQPHHHAVFSTDTYGRANASGIANLQVPLAATGHSPRMLRGTLVASAFGVRGVGTSLLARSFAPLTIVYGSAPQP